MKEYMLYDVAPLSEEEIKQAMIRAHKMRSEAAWRAVVAIVSLPVKLVRVFKKTKALDGSGLVHS